MTKILQDMANLVMPYLPNLLGALVVLAAGLVIAPLLSALVRAGLKKISLDKNLTRWALGGEGGKPLNVEHWTARLVYYVAMLFVLVAFFQVLGLVAVTKPLESILNELFKYVPQVVGAALILLVAWILASVLKIIVLRFLLAAKVDSRMGDLLGGRDRKESLARSLANAVYWVIFLLFLPALISTLKLEGLLAPMQGMLGKVFDYLPNMAAAALILLIGWFFAGIVQKVVTNLLGTVGTDQLSRKLGLDAALGKDGLARLLGLVVYIVILIPVLIATLGALKLQTITEPAIGMLNKVMSALPNIFAAVLLVLVSYLVGRVVARMVTNLLASAGFDSLLMNLGLGKGPRKGERTLSEIVGVLVLVVITLFAATEALGFLKFATLAGLMAEFLRFVGQVVLALVIMGVGAFMANLSSKAIMASKAAKAGTLAMAAKVAILVVAAEMALTRMGWSLGIVNIAFGILLGGAAVAVAIAFGLGGRDYASRKLEEWTKEMNGK